MPFVIVLIRKNKLTHNCDIIAIHCCKQCIAITQRKTFLLPLHTCIIILVLVLAPVVAPYRYIKEANRFSYKCYLIISGLSGKKEVSSPVNCIAPVEFFAGSLQDRFYSCPLVKQHSAAVAARWDAKGDPFLFPTADSGTKFEPTDDTYLQASKTQYKDSACLRTEINNKVVSPCIVHSRKNKQK